MIYIAICDTSKCLDVANNAQFLFFLSYYLQQNIAGIDPSRRFSDMFLIGCFSCHDLPCKVFSNTILTFYCSNQS